VPTCRLDEHIADVRKRIRETGWDTCIVVNDEGVVLGQIGRNALQADEAVTVEEAMTSGPSTVRPNAAVESLRRRIEQYDLTTVIVTRSDGHLVGIVHRDDVG
jgi:Mg/Co/Ni transporter MgtE